MYKPVDAELLAGLKELLARMCERRMTPRLNRTSPYVYSGELETMTRALASLARARALAPRGLRCSFFAAFFGCTEPR